MLYKWKLKDSEYNYVIHEGKVETSTQEEAMKIINEELNIHPHAG